MLGDINALLGMLIVMLFFSVIMDGFTIFNILVRHSDDAIEYACVGLKWPKIVLVFFFGVVMLYYSFSVKNTPLLLLADGVLSTVVKKKYGKKGAKK